MACNTLKMKEDVKKVQIILGNFQKQAEDIPGFDVEYR